MMTHTVSISLSQARKAVILQHQLYLAKTSSKGPKATLQSIEHMGYVQIDSISVVERAHHHSLYNRVKDYQPAHLANLLKQAEIFEYWSHAAAYLPIEQYRFSLPRKLAIKSGVHHWFKKDEKMMALVLETIKDKGPLMAKDFAHEKRENSGWWDWKPAKVALEQLFMQGDLMVVERKGFQKVYDLTQQVLPAHIDKSAPSQSEYCEFLILQYLNNNALAKVENFAYLLKAMKTDIKKKLLQLLERGVIITVLVANEVYYAKASFTQVLERKLTQQKVKILSPFDNLVIQRKRMRELFDFDYQIECYVPATKRKYGYFSLPVLQGQRFIARMDAKMHRKEHLLSIAHLHLHTHDFDKIVGPLAQAIKDFMLFNQASVVEFDRLSIDDYIAEKYPQGASKSSLNIFKRHLNQQLQLLMS